VKQVFVAFLMLQFVVGCVATSNDLNGLRANVADDRRNSRAEQEELQQRVAQLEARLRKFEKSNFGNATHEGFVERIAAIEAELKKIEQSSALGVQMGLISTVHADRNEQGISGIRTELNRLSGDIHALQARILESDKQLETGLLQLKDLSTKLK
jgi:hypothetical protein